MTDLLLARRRCVAALPASAAILAFLLLPVQLPARAQARKVEPVLVVSPKNPVNALQRAQVAALFLGHASRFPDGAPAQALDLPLGSALRDAFYHRTTGMSPAMLKQHWTRMMFTGHAQPPRELAGSAAVRSLVAHDPSMIGYIDRHALDASVKVVQVLH